MIPINLNADSQLFLTRSEAIQLALDLTDQLQASHEILIADVPLTVKGAEQVLRTIGWATGSVDWKVEGF